MWNERTRPFWKLNFSGGIRAAGQKQSDSSGDVSRFDDGKYELQQVEHHSATRYVLRMMLTFLVLFMSSIRAFQRVQAVEEALLFHVPHCPTANWLPFVTAAHNDR
jgi:hypothetical protein